MSTFNHSSGSGRSKSNRKRFAGRRAVESVVERLEYRRLMSTAVLNYHGNDPASDGQNLTETTLNPGNVNVNTFGKLRTTPLDGSTTAEPLYDPGVNITSGASQGVHNVVYVATENDSLYAIDSLTGNVLWKDSFLVPEAALTATGASVAVSTVLASDVNTGDTPIIGITGTPTIDPNTNSLFLVAKTKQIVNGNSTTPHFVQVLYKVDIGGGTYTGTVIADTTYNTSAATYTYNSGPYVLDPHGQGAGVVTATVNGASQKVIYFNALRQFSRVGLTLYNGNVYLGFASHGDNSPYHGWILGYTESSLTPTAAFNSNPDGSDDGIWSSGGKIAFDSSGNMYVETGNGTFDTTLTAGGFPVYGDYGDSFIKIALDPTTTATNQNINGWGLKAVDYFTPYNQASLSGADEDMGSGAPMVLPASLGSAAHPNLITGSGKNGVVYLLDTANMGKFSPTTDNVVQEISGGIGGGGAYDTPALFNNGSANYVVYAGKNDAVRSFPIANGSLGTAAVSTMTIGQFGCTPQITASGTNNGIAWVVDTGSDVLRAFNPTNPAQEYYDSTQNSSRDAMSTSNKFQTLTIADGLVFLANATSLLTYGLVSAPTTAPTAPTSLVPTVISNDQINLAWNDTATNAFGYYVEQQAAGSSSWVQIGSVGSSGNSFKVVGLTPNTTYSFRVRAYNSVGTSGYTNVASATTANTTTVPNYSGGFASSAGQLQLNGAAKLSGSSLEITDGGGGEDSSAFTTSAVSVLGFTTTFAFQLTSASGDGFTFTLQNQGPTALANGGGDLGYGGSPGINPGVAIKFDLYSNNGEGTDSTGLFVNGDDPEVPTGAYPVEATVDMTSSGVVLSSGDPMSATLAYNGTVLSETITDTSTGKVFSHNYTVNLPSYVGGAYAYVGFTGGTGGATAIQKVSTWTYSAVAAVPYAPTNLTVTPASGTELDLAWNEQYSNVTNFNILESTGGAYSQVGQVLGSVTNFNVTGLTSNSTYSFEVVAVNSAGSSPASSAVSGTTPYAPAAVSNLVASNVTSTGATISWINHATNATGIRVTRQLESDNSQYVGTFSATTTSFTDSNLLPGRAYDYEVVATNLAGPSAGVDVIVETIPSAPATPVASVSGNAITLNWAAYGHAVSSYNVYRGTTAGGEGATPIATGVTGTSYTDSGLAGGVTYFYKITAVDDGGEGPKSVEASAAITAGPLVISTAAAYLKLDADGVHLDVWNNSTASGAPTQTLLSQISSLSVNGPAGTDSVVVDFSAGNPLPGSGLNVSSAGTESLSIKGTAGNDVVSVGANSITLQAGFGSASVNYANTGSISFNGTTGADTLTQTAQPGGGSTLAFVATTSSDTLNVNGGVYTFAAGTATGINHQTLGSLNVAAGTKAVLASPSIQSNRTLLTVNTISIAGAPGAWTGQLDLGSNDLDVQSTPIGNVNSLVQSGLNYAGGANWTGYGITSSAAASDPTHTKALGAIVSGTLFGTTTFDGINPAAADVLVKYTYFGDANLDGRVDGSDYALIDGGYANASTATGWINGDFNYDGQTDGSDYALIDNAFNNQTATLSPNALVAESTAVAASVRSSAVAGPVITAPVSLTKPTRSRSTGQPLTIVPVGPIGILSELIVSRPSAVLAVSPFYQGKRKVIVGSDELGSPFSGRDPIFA